MTCPRCNGTGEIDQRGSLDCPCGIADVRANLNDMVKALGPITREDLAWALYQAGEKAAEQRFAAERTELVASLYAMRGWALVLRDMVAQLNGEGHLPDDDWALDMAKSNLLLKSNMGGKAWK